MITAELQALEVAIDTIQQFKGNPKLGDVEAIRESLRLNGQYRPLIVRHSTMEILAGNHTWQAARSEGWENIWVNFIECDDQTATRINLADNRTAELGTYNEEQLLAQLSKLPDLYGTGWTDQDQDRLSASLVKRIGGDTDAKAKPEKAITKRGDLYIMGQHRLLCGDSTSAEDVGSLMGGDKAVCVWLEAPYNGPGDNSGQGAGATGASHVADSLRGLLMKAFGLANDHLTPGCPVYMHYPGGVNSVLFGQCYTAQGWKIRQTLVWVKEGPNVAWDHDYGGMHELIYEGGKPADPEDANAALMLYGLKGRAGPDREHWYGDRKQCSVLFYERPHNDFHPTARPVGLIEQCLVNSTPRGGVVLDPFAGSGTTLIAAHNIARCARLIEIDPGYCDCIVDRWERHSGEQAIKIRA